jgi:hypothetical protein
MKNILNNLSKETKERAIKLFNVTEITEEKDTLFIKSTNTMSFEWAKYILKDLKSSCNYINYCN